MVRGGDPEGHTFGSLDGVADPWIRGVFLYATAMCEGMDSRYRTAPPVWAGEIVRWAHRAGSMVLMMPRVGREHPRDENGLSVEPEGARRP